MEPRANNYAHAQLHIFIIVVIPTVDTLAHFFFINQLDICNSKNKTKNNALWFSMISGLLCTKALAAV